MKKKILFLSSLLLASSALYCSQKKLIPLAINTAENSGSDSEGEITNELGSTNFGPQSERRKVTQDFVKLQARSSKATTPKSWSAYCATLQAFIAKNVEDLQKNNLELERDADFSENYTNSFLGSLRRHAQCFNLAVELVPGDIDLIQQDASPSALTSEIFSPNTEDPGTFSRDASPVQK